LCCPAEKLKVLEIKRTKSYPRLKVTNVTPENEELCI